MSYLSTHRKNILDKASIDKTKIQVGDILEFRYRGKKDKFTKTKLVLVINIYPVIGATKEKKVHAFSLEKLSMSVFKRLLSMTGIPILEIDKRKGKEVSKVIIRESGEKGEVFYRKVSDKFKSYNAYRTYKMSEMKAIKLIEYDWKSKQLGLKDEDLLQDTDA